MSRPTFLGLGSLVSNSITAWADGGLRSRRGTLPIAWRGVSFIASSANHGGQGAYWPAAQVRCTDAWPVDDEAAFRANINAIRDPTGGAAGGAAHPLVVFELKVNAAL